MEHTKILKPGIYLEIKPVSREASGSSGGLLGFKHAYLVYRKPDGTSEVIRGDLGKYAKISVETGKSLEKSRDKLGPDEKPGSRPSRKLDISPEKLDETWSKMRDKAEEIGKAGIDYRSDTDPNNPDQTSNSVVRAALDEAGVPLEKALPDGIDSDKLPGIHDNLAEKIEEARRGQEETRRERDRPNPIEGEIGGTDDQKPTPPNGDLSGDNGPSGQDDGVDDNSSGDDSSGDGQNQSARLPDPGDDTGNETKDFTPEQNKLMDDFGKTDGPLDEILAKDPGDLTEGEFLELKKAMINLPAGPEQERLDAMATAFLDDKFGTGPVEFDAVGRMIDPKPKKPINKNPVPAKTPDGEPLRGALNRIGKAVAGAAGGDGSATAVQALQTGLNILKQVMLKDGSKTASRTPDFNPQGRLPKRPLFSTILVPDLKTDGVVGPRTRRALRIATSNLGRPRIEEGFALGRFGRFALGVQTGRDDTRKLGATIGKAFGPLFRNPKTPRPRPNRPAEENLSFQATVNDLGFKAFGEDKFQLIKEDGFIGPRTETAFNAVLPAAGPDRFTSRLGHNMGFFDFDDIG